MAPRMDSWMRATSPARVWPVPRGCQGIFIPSGSIPRSLLRLAWAWAGCPHPARHALRNLKSAGVRAPRPQNPPDGFDSNAPGIFTACFSDRIPARLRLLNRRISRFAADQVSCDRNHVSSVRVQPNRFKGSGQPTCHHQAPGVSPAQIPPAARHGGLQALA